MIAPKTKPTPAEGPKVATDAPPIFVVLLPAGESELQAKGTQKVGWGQDGLSPKGIEQAKKAGKLMSQSGIQFDAVFTSVQKQAVYTAWNALMEGQDLAVPQYKSYRLNDRHWGKLQGRSEKDLEQSYDKEHLKNWTKDAPPPLEHSNVQHPVQDPLYRAIPQTLQPGSESMRNVFDRVLPLLSDNITPMLQMGKSILVVGHEASIYAMCQLLEGDDELEDEEFPQGEPWILEIDQELFVKKKVVLNDGFLRRLQFRFSDTAGDLVPTNPGKAGPAGNAGNGVEGNAAAPPPPKVKEEYTIEVTILSAKNLRDADWMYGTSDPYCWVKTSNKEDEPFSTKTISNASNVVKWDEKKTIKIKRGTSLNFSIWDEDWGKKDDHLGECTLNFEDILENFNGKMALLEQSGKVAPGKTGKGAFLHLSVKVLD